MNNKLIVRNKISFFLIIACVTVTVIAVLLFIKSSNAESEARSKEIVATSSKQLLEKQKKNTKEILEIYFSSQNLQSMKGIIDLFLSKKDSVYAINQYNNYINLVRLQEEYYKLDTNQLTVTKELLSKNYDYLGRISIYFHQYKNAVIYLQKSIYYDSTYLYPKVSLPHAYLLSGQYDKAKSLYLEFMDKPFNGKIGFPTFKYAFLNDFEQFKKAGIKSSDMDSIKNLLKQNIFYSK